MSNSIRWPRSLSSVILLTIGLCNSCVTKQKISIIFDTDANNEIDDQHALAYLFFNSNTFKIRGITTNSTTNGGTVEKHFDEARRIMQLCKWHNRTPLILGANGNFEVIEMGGVEADDVIATLAERLGKDNKILISSPDKDLTQLVSKSVIQHNSMTNDFLVVLWPEASKSNNT